MKKITISLLALSIVVLLASCGDILDSGGNIRITPIEGKTNKNVIQSLNIGNLFIFNSKIWDQKADKDSIYINEMLILRDTLIGDTRWFTSDKEGKSWIGNKPDGLHHMSLENGKIIFDVLYMKYPAKVGDTYFADSLNWTVKSIDTLITVNAGKFRCLYYYGVVPGLQEFYWHRFYCPGIGNIKDVVYWLLVRNIPIGIMELEDYRIVNDN